MVEIIQKFINNPDFFIEKGKTLKTTEDSSIDQIDIDSTFYIVKSYNIQSHSLFSERCLKQTRSRISWYNAHLLKQLGDHFLYPVCFMEKRFGPLCTKAYFVIKDFPEPEKDNLPKLFDDLENNKLNPEQKDF